MCNIVGAAHAFGFKIRQRYCENPPPSNGGLTCRGDAVDMVECFDFPPCFEPGWPIKYYKLSSFSPIIIFKPMYNIYPKTVI
jgi:hypothetical protein